MGTNQLLLLVLGVLIVGIAVVVSLQMFDTQFSGQIKDMAINQMHEISANAITHWKKPQDFGGGSLSYVGFEIPKAIEDGSLNWKFDLRSSENELNYFMISKDLAYNGKPYFLQGVHKNGLLVLIKLFNPEKNKWETLFEETEKEEAKGFTGQTGNIKKENLMKNKAIEKTE